MALMTRLNRLFQADMHALLDRLEAPEILLRQALREMEDALAHGSRSLAANEAEARRINARLTELETQRGRIGEELDLAFTSGNESLVRTLLKRRLLLESHLSQWHARIERLTSAMDEQREQLADRRQRLSELQEQSDLLTSSEAVANDTNGSVEPTISESDVELALLAEKQRRAS
jgi:phage shock protein A